MSENYSDSQPTQESNEDGSISPADRPEQNLPGMRPDNGTDDGTGGESGSTSDTEPNQESPHESDDTDESGESGDSADVRGADALTPLDGDPNESTDESATGGSSSFGAHGSTAGGDGGTVR